MIVETSESPSVSVEFSPEACQILSYLSKITPDESPNEPPLLNDIHLLCDLHIEVPRLITLSDNNHKSFANLHNRLLEFTVGDDVKLEVPHQRYPPETWEKLHNR